ANAYAAGIIDGVGHSRAGAGNAELAHALGLQRVRLVVKFRQIDRVDVGYVGMYGNMIFRKVMVDEVTVARVDDEILGQRRADAEHHAADLLAARGFRVQNPACGEYAEHAADPDLASIAVHRHLAEMRPVT